MDKQTFTFTHDSLAAYLSVGSFTLDGDTLTAATDDGRYTYVFRLTDDDTLTFVPEGSSLLPSCSGQTPETDQLIFHLREETI